MKTLQQQIQDRITSFKIGSINLEVERRVSNKVKLPAIINLPWDIEISVRGRCIEAREWR